MEARNISLTLEKAREWYNSGSKDLKEVALQAFTEDELSGKDFKKFKSWEDIEKDLAYRGVNFYKDTVGMTRDMIALLKVRHIRQVLNRGQRMELTKGTIYYPYTPFVTKKSTYYNDELKRGSMEEVAQFKVGGEIYKLLGGKADDVGYAGLGLFDSYYGVGSAYANVGFLGCASREIAEHMSKYFAKEIFEAKYGDFVDYVWV